MTPARSERQLEGPEADRPVRSKRPVSVDLLGKRITIVSDASDAHVRSVVDIVDQKLSETRRRASRASTEHVALLTALNMAEALVEAETRLAELRREVQERSRALLGLIDAMGQEIDTPRRMPQEERGSA